MTNESLTLFIPLYGKALMSREGLFPDPMAEKIVSMVDYDFSAVDTSRKLAVYMAMRAAQFDGIARTWAGEHPGGVIIHLGCGLDSRCCRVESSLPWYDLDLPEVIALRRAYYAETDAYHMLAAPAVPARWLKDIPFHTHALILAEGLSMYLSQADMRALMVAFQQRFSQCDFIFDAYSSLAARLSKWKNPINAVKARIDFAMDDPSALAAPNIKALPVRDMVTASLLERLPERERSRFRFLGWAGKHLYRIYGYRLTKM